MADIYFISQKTIGVRMSETATVSFRTDPKVKEEAKALYESMGMSSFPPPSTSSCANPFATTACRSRSPANNRRALRHVGRRKHTKAGSFTSSESLMKDLMDA